MIIPPLQGSVNNEQKIVDCVQFTHSQVGTPSSGGESSLKHTLTHTHTHTLTHARAHRPSR